MKNSTIQLPEGQSFNDHLKNVLVRDLKDGLEELYPIPARFSVMNKDTRLWRFDKGSSRFYYSPDKKMFFPSQTTIQSKTLPTGTFLQEWIDNMGGLEAANAYRDERGYFGTLEHIVQTEFLVLGGMDLSTVPDIVRMYRSIHELYNYNVKSWSIELTKDLSSFAQWAYDFKIEPIAVEIPITYPIKWRNGREILWIAGTIDLVAKITYSKKGFWGERYKSGENKGRPKQTYAEVTEIAVIDYKSGKKGFYKGHEIQVDSYLMGWNHFCKRNGFEEYSAVSCWNYAPKDSTGAVPTYSFVNQTGKRGREYMPHLTKIFMIDGSHIVKDVRDVSGVIKFGESAENNVVLMDAGKYLEQQYERKQEEGEAPDFPFLERTD